MDAGLPASSLLELKLFAGLSPEPRIAFPAAASSSARNGIGFSRFPACLPSKAACASSGARSDERPVRLPRLAQSARRGRDARSADVHLERWRPGLVARLRLAPDALRAGGRAKLGRRRHDLHDPRVESALACHLI